MVLEDAVSKYIIRDVCMDFEPYFKVHNLVSIGTRNVHDIKQNDTCRVIASTTIMPLVLLINTRIPIFYLK